MEVDCGVVIFYFWNSMPVRNINYWIFCVHRMGWGVGKFEILRNFFWLSNAGSFKRFWWQFSDVNTVPKNPPWFYYTPNFSTYWANRLSPSHYNSNTLPNFQKCITVNNSHFLWKVSLSRKEKRDSRLCQIVIELMWKYTVRCGTKKMELTLDGIISNPICSCS